jgi:tight adherence protein B
MNDPILLAGVGLLLGAVLIGIKLLMPKLAAMRAPQKPTTPHGLTDARDAMVDRTTKLVEKRSGRGLQNRLEQSGSQLRSGEWVLLVVAATVVLGALGYLLGQAIAAGILVVGTPIVANALLNRNINKRQEAFADQLPDFLQNLSSALRSGQSLPQSIASIAPDLESPAGDELRRVVIENRIGRDLIESFNDLAGRMNSIDFDWVVRAIEINYRTGGDLSVILRRLDSTIRARNHVAGTVRSLSAEGRISGVVLAALPPLLMLAVQIINPGFLNPLFTTALGRALLIGSCIQLLIGTIWLSKMAKFKF